MDSSRPRGPVPLLEDAPVPSQVDAEGGADERDRAGRYLKVDSII